MSDIELKTEFEVFNLELTTVVTLMSSGWQCCTVDVWCFTNFESSSPMFPLKSVHKK